MDEIQAQACVGLLQAYYPAIEFPASTVRTWREALLVHDHAIALRAVHVVGKAQLGRPVEIGDVLKVAEEIWAEEFQLQSLSSTREELELEAEAIVPASAEEARSILGEYWEGIGEDRKAVARMAHGRAHGDTELTVDAARRLAAQKIEAEALRRTAEIGAERPPTDPDPVEVVRSACGTRAGSRLRYDDATEKWVCPGCGSPVDEGCLPQRQETAS